jgi:HAE1 family hydrophobic/amphiphilic exporter-1
VRSKALYQFTLKDTNTDELYRAAEDLTERMRDLPGLSDVTSDLQIRNPQLNVEINRDAASAYGVTASQIENALYSAFGQRQVSTILAPNNQYAVIMELQPQYQRDAAAISSLYVRSKAGKLVPLSAIATLSPSVGPLSVNHLGQLPAVTIAFNLRPGMSLGQAVTDIGNLARQTLPSTTTTSFQGTAQAFQSSLTGIGMLIIMAILVIYIVLGVLYESFLHPITILSGLPSAGFGALLTLYGFHYAATQGWVSRRLDMNLDVYAFVGIIMLIGIVKKNAIMMIDFALDAERKHGLSPRESIVQASLLRFRPIMMTTLAALFGAIPLAFEQGTGSELRNPLGITIIGGLLLSQLLTLYTTPVIYLALERVKTRLARPTPLQPELDLPAGPEPMQQAAE